MSKPTTKRPASEAPSYRQRAAQARAAAGQPQPASLLRETGAESPADAFQAGQPPSQDHRRGHPEESGRAGAAAGPAPRREQDMGRHETFENAAPIVGKMPARASDSRAPRSKRKPVDWHNPPPGFMASPAIEPTSFACIEQGIRVEANRLLGIALAEQRRRQTAGIEGHSKPWDAEDEARTRKALHLDALAAIACPGSIHVAGIRYVPESEHTHAEREGRVMAGGIEHGDGTISYCDASETLRRRPFEHWVDFIVMHLHAKVQSEIARRRILETGHMSQDEHAVWEASIRCRLRADAVFALAFRPDRAFAAAEAERSGSEPRTADERHEGDAELRALAPAWMAARDLYAQRTQEQIAVCDAADDIEARPSRDLPHEEWLRQAAGWRERTGVEDAEAASGEALVDLCDIEDKIAALPAATLAGLKLKALVAQRNDDIDIEWPDDLGAGLVRDILAFVETRPVDRPDLTDPDTLTTAILDLWPICAAQEGQGTDEQNAASEEMQQRRLALLDAAAALPATPETIQVKALALAWIDYVHLWCRDQKREDYATDGQLAVDIHLAALARATPPVWRATGGEV